MCTLLFAKRFHALQREVRPIFRLFKDTFCAANPFLNSVELGGEAQGRPKQSCPDS